VNASFKYPLERQSLPTVALSSFMASISIGSLKVELQIWDTARQERFQSISKMFYRESSVALVCYDQARFDSTGSWVANVREE
jgi:GTPase SAR1 family protein